MSDLIRTNLFPGARRRAITMSYDDGVVHDQKLVEIFDRYGVRGSFHLNSGTLDREGYLRSSEIAGLFARHEVSAHTVSHPVLDSIPTEMLVQEILHDRERLESLVGYPVRGMSYPFGTYTDAIVAALPLLGIEYARTVHAHGGFGLPHDFLRWPATCHHNDRLLERGHQFVEKGAAWGQAALMYVWGHSYEFENDGKWSMIEEFCKLVGRNDAIWYATNVEVMDYIKAVRGLRFSVAGSSVHNPSALSVWISIGDAVVEVRPGETLSM